MKYGPRISVCIATFNEDENLEATIALVYASKYKPHEVIVCDDNSEIDPVKRLASWTNKDNFKYIRNAQRMGSGPTKQNAMDAATGDLVIILDSHMRPHRDWLSQIAAAHIEYPNALLCTESIGFDQPQAGGFYGRGAWFDPDNIYKHGAHTISWLPSEKVPQLRYPRIQAMHGGCYIFPKYQLKSIHGYAPLLRGWGYEEEWVAMRAAAYGIETRLIAGCPIAHEYKRSLHRRPAVDEGRPQGWEPYYNRHVVAIAAYGWQKWVTFYKDAIIEGTEIAMRPFVEKELAKDKQKIAEFRTIFSHTSMRTEQWMPRLGLSHPEDTQNRPQATPVTSSSDHVSVEANALESTHRPVIGGNLVGIVEGKRET